MNCVGGAISRVAFVPLKLSKNSLFVTYQNSANFLRVQLNANGNGVRNFKTSALLKENERHFVRRAKDKMTLKEKLMQPTSGTAFGIGQGLVAGGAVMGIGALCYYGLGYAAEPGAVDRSHLWPEYVKNRIKSTYMYFGASLGLTAAAAAMSFRSPALMSIMMKNSWVVLGGSLAAVIGTGMVARSIPYQEGVGVKQLCWALHSATLGVVLAPMCLLGGPILLRAAWYTAGIVGGLSVISACAPSEKFLQMGGPLGIGLGVVFASSIGTMFLPPASALGAGLYSIAMYGGLLLFSGFLLYDTQKIIRYAESVPPPGYNAALYDPVNASMSIYMDTVNIFIRIAQMLAMGQLGRKK